MAGKGVITGSVHVKKEIYSARAHRLLSSSSLIASWHKMSEIQYGTCQPDLPDFGSFALASESFGVVVRHSEIEITTLEGL